MSGKDKPVILENDAAGIAAAARLLREGGLVALPTETVYGLAARADRAEAAASIYRAKGRPDFNPLIVHVASLAQAEGLARLDARAKALAEAFWPGPLTMVLPVKPGAGIAAAVTAGLPTIAIRMPAHPVMQAVLQAVGVPLAAPSANRSGAVSPTCAAHVVASLGGRVDAVLDAGACPQGLESTIVALRPDDSWRILRPGTLTQDRISAVLGHTEGAMTPDGAIEAPGQMASHYAPGKPVRLEAVMAGADEFLIGFGAVKGECSLSASGDLAEAAARLYDCLHQAAAAPHSRIAVAPVPHGGIGAAINDRLRRASA